MEVKETGTKGSGREKKRSVSKRDEKTKEN